MIYDLRRRACRRRQPARSRAVRHDHARRRQAPGARWATVTTASPATSSRSTATRRIFRARTITFPIVSPTSCRCSFRWAPTTRSSSRDAHNYWEFNYTTNWIHPALRAAVRRRLSRSSRHRAGRHLPRRRARCASPRSSPVSASGSTSIAAAPSCSATIPIVRAIPICSTPRSTRSANFASASCRAASRARCSSTRSSGSRRSSRGEHDLQRRLSDGYKAAVALVDSNGDGIVSALEGDIDTANANCPQGDNSCFFLRAASVRPLRRDARDQRRLPRAALRAVDARMGPRRRNRHRLPGAGDVRGARFRRSLR